MNSVFVPSELLDEVRLAALSGKIEAVHARLSAQLGDGPGPIERGSLHLGRALLTQNSSDARPAAADATAAWEILRRTDERGYAAYAAAAAASLLQRCGRLAEAVDLAVDAMLLLDEVDIDRHTAVRVANGLAIVFAQLSSFDIAVDLSERAFRGLSSIDYGASGEIVCFTLTYITVDGCHATDDPPRRWFDLAHEAAAWIREHAITPIGSEVLSHGIQIEFALLDGDDVEVARLLEGDDGSDLATYSEGANRVIAWHRFVRGVGHSRVGNPEIALRLLDDAIEELALADDQPRLARAMNERVRVHTALGDHDVALADAVDLAARARRWQVDQVGRLAAQISRRAELERAQDLLSKRAEQLEKEAAVDVVTGIATRREMERYLDVLEQLGGSGAVVIFDLDRFKTVNDRFGHRVGDLVLRRFGGLLRATVGPDDLAARFGGEEFAVILPDADAVTAQAYAERIRARLGGETWDDAFGLSVTSSAGVAVGPLREIRMLLHRADSALYDAKRAGRDRVVLASLPVVPRR